MGAFIDLTGKTFSRLTVLEKTAKQGKEWYWKCHCECGNTCEVRGSSLRSNRTKSCGCLKKEIDRAPKGNVKDLLGQKFGHLTVIARDGSDHRGEAKWICECDCKSHSRISVLGSNLRSGHTQSCGCDRRSHGEKAVQELLEKNNISFTTEYSPFAFENGYKARFDFFINNSYIIEYDGETHFKYNLSGWHTEDHYLEQQKRDKIKNQWCLQNNIPLIRIPYTVLSSLSIEDLIPETSKFLIKEANDEEM